MFFSGNVSANDEAERPSARHACAHLRPPFRCGKLPRRATIRPPIECNEVEPVSPKLQKGRLKSGRWWQWGLVKSCRYQLAPTLQVAHRWTPVVPSACVSPSSSQTRISLKMSFLRLHARSFHPLPFEWVCVCSMWVADFGWFMHLSRSYKSGTAPTMRSVSCFALGAERSTLWALAVYSGFWWFLSRLHYPQKVRWGVHMNWTTSRGWCHLLWIIPQAYAGCLQRLHLCERPPRLRQLESVSVKSAK